MRHTLCMSKYNTGHAELDLRHHEMVSCFDKIDRAITGIINYINLGRLGDEFIELCAIHAHVEFYFFIDHGRDFDSSAIDTLAHELDCAIRRKAGMSCLMTIADNLSVALMVDILTGKVEMDRLASDEHHNFVGLWGTSPPHLSQA